MVLEYIAVPFLALGKLGEFLSGKMGAPTPAAPPLVAEIPEKPYTPTGEPLGVTPRSWQEMAATWAYDFEKPPPIPETVKSTFIEPGLIKTEDIYRKVPY